MKTSQTTAIFALLHAIALVVGMLIVPNIALPVALFGVPAASFLLGLAAPHDQSKIDLFRWLSSFLARTWILTLVCGCIVMLLCFLSEPFANWIFLVRYT